MKLLAFIFEHPSCETYIINFKKIFAIFFAEDVCLSKPLTWNYYFFTSKMHYANTETKLTENDSEGHCLELTVCS